MANVKGLRRYENGEVVVFQVPLPANPALPKKRAAFVAIFRSVVLRTEYSAYRKEAFAITVLLAAEAKRIWTEQTYCPHCGRKKTHVEETLP